MRMKFTQSQKAILDAIANDEKVLNISQRMRAIQPLIDAGIIELDNRIDEYGLSYTAGLKFVE